MAEVSKWANKRIHHQPGSEAYLPAAVEALNQMDGHVRQMSSNPQLFLTKEIGRGVQNLADQVALLKFGETLYKNANEVFKDRIPEREITTRYQATLKNAEHLADPGGQLTKRFIKNLDVNGIDCSNSKCAASELGDKKSRGVGWTGSALRSSLAWANGELEGLHNSLEPLVDVSRSRVSEYMDYLGTTDRYKNYRVNLNPPACRPKSCSAPRLTDTALISSERPKTAGRWDLPKEYERALAVGTDNYHPVMPHTKLAAWNQKNYLNMDDEEAVLAAGCVRKYPGRSEFQDAYIHPSLHEDLNEKNKFLPATFRHRDDQPKNIRGRASTALLDSMSSYSKGYKVNPLPDYSEGGKASGQTAGYDLWYSPASEYSHQYVWPDGKRIRVGVRSTPLV